VRRVPRVTAMALLTRTPRDRRRHSRGAAAFRVLLTEWRLTEDGAARSSLRLVVRWQEAGACVRLFVLTRGSSDLPLPPGVVPLYPTRKPRHLRHVIVQAGLRLLRQAHSADVVVAGRELGFGMLASWLAARVVGAPFVVIIRSEPLAAIESYVAPRWQAANRRALAAADAVICISSGLASAAEAAGVAPERVHVVLNGVETGRVLRSGAGSAAGLPAGEGPLVVGVGRVEHQKGFDLLVRAHARLVEEGRPHRLLVLGDGRDRPELERLATELGVRESVHLPGFTPEPLPVLAAADLFCLPSRWEGFGQSLAEALVLGRPTIAADCVSGPRELLADGRHGDLVPVDDVEALTAAIRRHLDDPRRLQEAARLGQEWVMRHLDVDRTAAEMLDILATVEPRGWRARRGLGRRRGPRHRVADSRR